jgi:hypothetical protein
VEEDLMLAKKREEAKRMLAEAKSPNVWKRKL